MEIRYPDYYKKFQCIAGDCPDTCCAGWEIPVDAASEKRYRVAVKSGAVKNKEFVRKLKKHVRDGRIISEDVTCPFLNRDGLCEMYIELGPDSLCHTCARHPRHMEDYGNLREMVLLLSCPEVARLVLEENDGGFYVRNYPERRGNMDGIDEELLTLLLQMRELIWTIIKDETVSVNQRMAYVLALGHDVQRRIQNEKSEEIPAVLERYGRAGAVERFLVNWKTHLQKELYQKKHCQKEYSLKKNFRQEEDALPGDLQEKFASLETVWQKWSALHKDYQLETISQTDEKWLAVFAYYIYSFLLSALYDEDVLTKIKMAVSCTLMTAELTKASDLSDVEICYAVARQIENSDENRQRLELAMKKEMFGSRRFINALLEV